MQIGYVMQRSQVVIEGGERKERKYTVMDIRAPFVRPQQYKLSKNDKGDNANAPDYVIYMYVNGRNEKFRLPKVGALWIREKEGMKYMSGHIETPMSPQRGRVDISLFKAKPLYEGENISWLYDVVWSHYDGAQQSGGYEYDPQSSYTPTPAQGGVTVETQEVPAGSSADAGRNMPAPEVDADGDEIPF